MQLLQAQPSWFIGGVGGVSTLSADGRSVISAASTAISLYKPQNGPALNLFGGVHVNDYVSFQVNYVWNRNDVMLTSARFSGLAEDTYEQARQSAQHAVIGDLLIYFRRRGSRIRPYLSVGVGAVRLDSSAGSVKSIRGSPDLPPERFTSTGTAVRSAVGADVAVGGGWSVRYTFSETIGGNALSERLSPPGERNLANYQNLVGVVKSF